MACHASLGQVEMLVAGKRLVYSLPPPSVSVMHANNAGLMGCSVAGSRSGGDITRVLD